MASCSFTTTIHPRARDPRCNFSNAEDRRQHKCMFKLFMVVIRNYNTNLMMRHRGESLNRV